LWETRGYNNRRAAVDDWYSMVALLPHPEPPSKTKRSFLGMGKKKSMAALSSQFARQSLDDVPAEAAPNGAGGLVFGTSLAAGMPMSPLPLEHTQQLLQDLPTLQQIWLTTAEALIL